MSKFSEIQLTLASDQAVAGIQKHICSLATMARSFSARAAEQFTGVAVPAFANLSGATVCDASNLTADIWANGEELQGAVVALEKNISKVYKLTDYEAAATDNLYLADGARSIAEQVSLEAVKYVFQNTLGDANLSTVQTLSDYTVSAPSTKAGFAGLFSAASDAGLNPYDCTLVLDAATFAALLGTLGDSYIYGGPEMVRGGYVTNLFGFRAVEMCPFLTSGTKGYIIPYNSLGVVSRYDKPAVDGYVETWTSTDPKTGFTIGYRVYEHLGKGAAFMGGNVLFGAKVLQKGIIKLV